MPTVRSGSAEIYYEVRGSGPAIVFAHGAGGNTLSWWQQVPHFEREHTVVAFDHRSFGRSTCAPSDFHPKHFPGDLLAILDALGIARAALVCQSMGGWTGLRTALEHPERVACLVLGGTPGGVRTDAVLRAMASIGERLSDEGVVAQAALAPDFPAREPERAFLYQQISELNTGVAPTSLGRLFDAEAWIEPERLRDLLTPTLVIAGERDLLFPPEVLHEVAAAIPHAELVDLPGVGHSSYFEVPDEFNARVGAFVDEHLG